MHKAAFDHLGIRASYRALEVAPSALSEAVARFRTSDSFLGANVTVPHKRAVMSLLDEVSVEAMSIGAVNTIVSKDGRLLGSNTDAVGFARAVEELSPATGADRGSTADRALTRGAGGSGPARALILGAGGSARAVAWALLRAGTVVGVHARRQEAAVDLVAELDAGAAAPGALVAVNAADVATWLSGCELLVNCTTVGMAGGNAPQSLASPEPLSLLRREAAVMDLVYRPPQTPLLREAERLGLGHLNGLSMLVWQGAASFETWTGQRAPVEVMRRAAEAALR